MLEIEETRSTVTKITNDDYSSKRKSSSHERKKKIPITTKFCTRIMRGRDFRRPYTYDPEIGMYTQRDSLSK